MSVSVQTEDFDVGLEVAKIRKTHADAGAVVCFVGQVRDINNGDQIGGMTLEHYPGMTEKSLQTIEQEARKRWNILEATVIHRVGTLKPQDQIVLVAVASAHRGDAFQACEFMMDYLKTQAPFWKKEQTEQGDRWVEAKTSDDEAQVRWENTK
ncbi:MAG TPA: molybdopterin synthase catalytic subunit MoaE [Methylophilus sp.]|nr:molybdopterin synthase catalytic subunit MoaE [Methylophilus sp.]HQQ33507.1 molybdopterin synthase catalytic subunit MoaE [Methylophilus sp.]